MFSGDRKYSCGAFKPEPGVEHNWQVLEMDGALEMLRKREFADWLIKHPGEAYTINFANGAAAIIGPGHELWQALAEVAKTYDVSVFPLALDAAYVPWTGAADSPKAFDAIKIQVKERKR